MHERSECKPDRAQPSSNDVIVIGGGVIGLSIARRLAGRKSVLLLDRGATGQGTSWAAAGMLSPLSEADDQGTFFRMCLESLRMFRAFVDELRDETGIDPHFGEHGLLYLASSDESLEILRKRYEWQRHAGFDVQLLSREEVQSMEPLITAPAPGALYLPEECSVVPRRLVNALRESCIRRGVDIRTGVRVDAVSKNAVRAGRTVFEASHIVVSAGVWASDIQGLDPPIAVYPRKGQILSVRMPEGAFGHMVRWQHCYFISRAGGEMVIGATDEDAGFDLSLTVGGVGRILAEAYEISSHVADYPILEMWTGLRPATRDGLPIIGPSNIPGVIYATGHYRNGVLLAPVTASMVADLL